jgi:hypothetical protein
LVSPRPRTLRISTPQSERRSSIARSSLIICPKTTDTYKFRVFEDANDNGRLPISFPRLHDEKNTPSDEREVKTTNLTPSHAREGNTSPSDDGHSSTLRPASMANESDV